MEDFKLKKNKKDWSPDRLMELGIIMVFPAGLSILVGIILSRFGHVIGEGGITGKTLIVYTIALMTGFGLWFILTGNLVNVYLWIKNYLKKRRLMKNE